MPICPFCQSAHEQVKSGRNVSGSQRFLCKHCARKYTPEPHAGGYSPVIKKQAVLMCLDGQSFRSIARKLGVNHQTVANWVDDYVAKSARAIYKAPK